MTVAPPIPTLLAHGGEPHAFHDLWTTWGWEPLPILGLVLSAWLYARGVRRLWRASRVGGGIQKWEAGCFAGGWAALFAALVSPIHPWGQLLFAAHMTQHEILMLAAAPLLVLGRPTVAFLRALPPRWAQSLARAANAGWWQRVWGFVTNALVAWMIHAALLWVWHLPALFQATLDHDAVHALQHASFLGSALLFWWALLHGRPRLMGHGLAVVYLFTTALHSGLLGALLTFARTVWYPAYAGKTQSWGLTPLEDQQLGGLIMWVPACTVYIIAGLALFTAWLRESEARVRAREARSDVQTPALV